MHCAWPHVGPVQSHARLCRTRPDSYPLRIHGHQAHLRHRMEEDKAIKMNDIARVKIRSTKPLFADDYTVNRVTGSIILVDEATNETVAAGMIR
jgi:sulfate adenylyltransferase subunit 1 (EFTu-like GTPase family)